MSYAYKTFSDARNITVDLVSIYRYFFFFFSTFMIAHQAGYRNEMVSRLLVEYLYGIPHGIHIRNDMVNSTDGTRQLHFHMCWAGAPYIKIITRPTLV